MAEVLTVRLTSRERVQTAPAALAAGYRDTTECEYFRKKLRRAMSDSHKRGVPIKHGHVGLTHSYALLRLASTYADERGL
jgi:hypothetical protein